MAKWVDEGETLVAEILFKTTDPSVDFDPLYVGLYTDSSEPAESDGLADISEVPVADGYGRESIARDTDWTVSGDEATAGQVSFTASGGAWGNVYGYFVTDGTNLIAVEHFSDGPYNVGDGDTVKITVKVTVS